MFGDREKVSRDQRVFLVRLLVLALAALAAISLLVARTSHLTLRRGQTLFDLSERNYVRLEKIPAPRGTIVDRHGRDLARSEARFNLLVSRFQIGQDELASTLSEVQRLCERVNAPPSQVKHPTLEQVLALRPSWKRELLAENLTFLQVVPFRERLPMLPGLRIEETFKRVYPYGRPAAFLTGYIKPIPREHSPRYLEAGYDLNDLVGVKGLERVFEKDLRGTKGLEIVHRNALGRMITRTGVYEDNVAVRGARLELTVDIELQCYVSTLLTTQPGAIVAMDPRNGEVLAMGSNPNYDANHPAGPGRRPGDSEVNKALAATFSPGSTIKLVTASAGLMHGKTSSNRTISCAGAFHLPDGQRIYRCEGYHGGIQLKKALERSCNTYFGQVTYDLGLSRFVETAQAFGLGEPTGIELRDPSDAGRMGPGGGVAYRPPLGTILQMGIGQGSLVLVSPLQMAVAYSTLANGGTCYNARLVREVRLPDAPPGTPPRRYGPVERGKVEWEKWQRDAVLGGLRAVVESPYGTGRHGKLDKAWKVAGKTGTAQTGKPEADAWFCCFSPWDAPEVCLVVLLEEAGHGGAEAAPVARKVLEEYYRLKALRMPPPPAPVAEVAGA